MNEDDTISLFSGRRPSFNSRGGVRGFRSRPGAPQANSAQGLTGGSNATSAVDWVSRFKTAGLQMKNAARSELGLDPLSAATPSAPAGAAGSDYAPGEDSIASMGSVGAAPSGGIAQQTIDGAFGAGHWNRMLGRAPDPLMTAKPFMPRGPGTAFNVPKPLTSPEGDKASDRAGLAANQALYAPGGMTGLWSKPGQEQWETPGLQGVSNTWKKYGADSRRYT